ncbi:MAG: hypothetical protein SGI88_01580 [Candidatus Hydrogenedentes bacterium]|nr:hypothetical protein [Candidatus Hydrogenedentota bacterium]
MAREKVAAESIRARVTRLLDAREKSLAREKPTRQCENGGGKSGVMRLRGKKIFGCRGHLKRL